VKTNSFTGRYMFLRAAFVLLAFALCTIPVVGQETTGTVTGHVTDPSGAVVPGAKVELSGGTLSKGVTLITSANGEYLFPSVPAGTGFKLVISSKGFRTASKMDLAVVMGSATTLDVKLEVGQITETVVVAADAVMVDTSSSSSAVTVDQSFFDILPKGRSFYDLIAIAPGARNEGLSGGYQVDGASGAENTFYLNGMEMESIQGGTLSAQNQVPIEMVQQVEIKNGVMDAQYGGAMGGTVSAVLKSGTNDFHGEFGFYWSGDGLSARPRPQLELDPFNDNNAIEHQNNKDAFNNWNPVFTIGGPIVHNRLFFFAGFMPQLNYTTRMVNFTTGETGSYNQEVKQEYGNGRVDYVPTSKIRVNMSWVFNPNKTMGLLPSPLGTDSFTNTWSQQGNFNGGNVLAGQIDYLATTKLILSFRGGYTYTNFNNEYGIPSTTAIYYSGKSTTLPPAALQAPNGWINQAVAADTYDINTRKNYAADASYMLNWGGQHTIKGGWQMNGLANNVLDSSYANGYYRYYWGNTYQCQTSSCNSVGGAAGTGTGTYGYYRYRVLGTIGGASSNNQGIFLQDNWRVNKRLSFNLGLRTEREYVPGFNTTGAKTTAILFNWPAKMSPRIGVAFDPKGDGKSVIRAGFGFFYDIMKYSLPRSSFGGDVWKEYFYTLDDPNLVTTNLGYAANPLKLPGTLIETVDYRIPSNDPSQHLIDPNLMPMKTRSIDLSYDYSLSPTLVASARFTDRRLIHTIEDVGYVSPGGEVYNIANPGYGIVASAANWQNWMGAGIPTTPKAVRNYDAVEFRLDKRFSRNYQFSASYTWSRLYGNYSGLASSDEGGRDNPDNSRYFDQPWIYGDAHGKNAMGLLGTDRPNTFKFFGGYTLRSPLGSTTFSPNIQLYSGTPLTSEAQVIDTQGWVYYNGRGDMGRTPVFFNTDFNIMHDFKPFKNHEAWGMRVEFSVFNLFNSDTVTNKYTEYTHQIDAQVNVDSIASIFSQGINVQALMAAQGIRVDPEYGQPNGFQSPRSGRLQISFRF
jgi:hypothetical protein